MTNRIFVSLLMACAVAATAQNSPRSTQKSSASPAPAAIDAQVQAKAAREYWTPERLANAHPMPLATVEPGSLDMTDVPGSPEPSHFHRGGLPTERLEPQAEKSLERFPLFAGDDADRAEPDAIGSPEGFNYVMPFQNFRTGINNPYPYATIGKLFFHIPAGASEKEGDYVCSGAVALDAHTVVTARHCMYDIANHIFYNSWVFYPGWNNGSDSTLGGAWHVNFAYTWTSNAPNWYWDIGLLSMHDSNGTGCAGSSKSKQIGNYTGWLGYWYGGDYSQRQWSVFGYPQAAPFEGNYLYQDNAATGELNPFSNSGIVEVGSPQTGGTSGGPWILGFDPYQGVNPTINNNITPAGDYNMVNGLNSFKWTDPNLPLTINGPEFNSNNFNQLYTNYKNYGHCG